MHGMQREGRAVNLYICKQGLGWFIDESGVFKMTEIDDLHIAVALIEKSFMGTKLEIKLEEKPKRLYKDRRSLRQEVHNILNSAEIPLSSEKILDRISDENKERRPLIRMLRKLCDDRLVIEESIEGLKKYSLVKWEFTHDSSLPPKT